MVAIDSTMMLLFLDPSAPGPTNAEGEAVTHARERVEYLISEMDKSGTRIILPTPVLSEVLIRMDYRRAAQVVENINGHSVFSVEPFDQRAAIEVALMLRHELGRRRRPKRGAETWAKLKYDRQIVAIAKVNRASVLYSDDGNLRSVAERLKIEVKGVDELPLPPGADQFDLIDEIEDAAE